MDIAKIFSWDYLSVERHNIPADHTQRFYQIPDEWLAVVTPLRGSYQVEGHDSFGRRVTTLVPGEICRIAPGKPVRIGRVPDVDSPFDLAYVRLPTEIFQNHSCEHRHTLAHRVAELHTLRSLDLHTASVLSSLVHAREAGVGDHYAASAARYLADHLVALPSGTPQRSGGLSEKQLSRTTAYMKANLDKKIALDQLAAEAGVSRYHFVRLFAVSTGETPMRYLTQLRISAARHLLVMGDSPISQIGRLCGFTTPDNFARVFRRSIGCTPSQYRSRRRPEGLQEDK